MEFFEIKLDDSFVGARSKALNFRAEEPDSTGVPKPPLVDMEKCGGGYTGCHQGPVVKTGRR